jgi:hypothetical protein
MPRFFPLVGIANRCIWGCRLRQFITSVKICMTRARSGRERALKIYMFIVAARHATVLLYQRCWARLDPGTSRWNIPNSSLSEGRNTECGITECGMTEYWTTESWTTEHRTTKRQTSNNWMSKCSTSTEWMSKKPTSKHSGRWNYWT